MHQKICQKQKKNFVEKHFYIFAKTEIKFMFSKSEIPLL